MIRIKDYIFPEENILYIRQIEKLEEENEKLNNRIHDITETLNETYNNRTKLRNENKELKSRINKAIEYIGNGNIGIPKKTREKFIKILKGEE